MSSLLLLTLLMAPPWIESSDFDQTAQERAFLTTLRLVGDDGKREGSAVRINRRGPFVYYLTAAHCVKDLEKVNLYWFTSKSYPKPAKSIEEARVLKIWPDMDLALVRAMEPEPFPCATIVPKDKTNGRRSFPAMAVGCADKPIPQLKITRITTDRLIHKLPNDKGVWCWESKDATIEGQSGGPLFDRDGYLIGICSGKNKELGYYVHDGEIRRVLDEYDPILLKEPPK